MYVCMYVCVYIYIYICVCVCACVCVCLCMRVRVCACVFVYMHKCIHTYTHTDKQRCMYVYIYIYRGYLPTYLAACSLICYLEMAVLCLLLQSAERARLKGLWSAIWLSDVCFFSSVQARGIPQILDCEVFMLTWSFLCPPTGYVTLFQWLFVSLRDLWRFLLFVEVSTIGAKLIANSILGVRYFSYSIAYPKTLF